MTGADNSDSIYKPSPAIKRLEKILQKKKHEIPDSKDDILRELLKKQKEFQEKYRNKFKDFPTSYDWATAMAAECLELWGCDGKWWKTKHKPRKEKLVELADVLHFFLGYMLSENITADELRNAYLKKLQVNYDRQERGY